MNYAENIILPGDTGARLSVPGRIPIFQGFNRWDGSLEREVRRLRAARRAVEAARRRHGPRVPLCSTTFGGSTVAPLFGGGGGGFLQGDIRINSVGADYISPTGGAGATTLTAPAADVGDELWIALQGTGGYAPDDPNWTLKGPLNSGNGGSFRTLSRVADGTANDNYTIAANTVFLIAKMWSHKTENLGEAFPSFTVQGGTINSTFGVNWDVGFPPGQTIALTLNTTGDPDKFVHGYFSCLDRQQPSTIQPTIIDGDPDGMETIMSLGAFAPTGGFSADTLITLIKFEYLATSIAYQTYTIGRIPGPPNTYGQFTQYQRLRIF